MNEFREHFPRILRGIFPLFCVLQTVHENSWFCERIGGGYNSGKPDTQTPLSKKGGQNSYENAFSFRMTIFLTVIARTKKYRQTAHNEKKRFKPDF